MDEQKTESAQTEMLEKAARRKIIKGLAGLPAVMTLGNVNAQAIASVYECALKEGQNPLVVAGNQVNLNTEIGNNGGVDNADCVDIDELQSPPAHAPTSTDLWDNSDDTLLSPVRQKPTVNSDQACVVFVDSNGTPGLTTTGSEVPVTASCYVSFTPT